MMIVININDVSFNVDGERSIYWFPFIAAGWWEDSTFRIIDHYADLKGIYVDIGAWIGPTVLYSASKYNRTICFEPDPVALFDLLENISLNDFNNITVIKKALSNSTSIIKFGA